MEFKKVKKYIIFVSVGLVSVGIWRLSESLINAGNKVERSVVENIEKDNNNKVSEGKVFLKDDDKDGYAEVEKLYSKVDLEKRQRQFLGDNYDRYKEAFSVIEENYEEVISSIPIADDSIDFSNSIILEQSNVDLFNMYSWESDTLYSDNMMTIVGFVGDYGVIYKYAYWYDDSINLVVVDYSNAEFNTDSKNLFGLGQEKSVLIHKDYSKVVDMGTYSILYVRGF